MIPLLIAFVSASALAQSGVRGRFYQQAVVLDSAAGNALGAVMSDAAAAVGGN